MSERTNSFLLGPAALVVWGDVDTKAVDDDALNDWWTNEHLPERLSIPGFLRARRYCYRNDVSTTTKYMTLYEVAALDILTSQAYMDKLDNPTAGTKQHLATLATMQRSACKVVHSEVRRDLATCRSGIGGMVAMFVLSLPSGADAGGKIRDLCSKAFSDMQRSDRSVMALSILQEDVAATQPGSASQSYINVNLKAASTDSATRVKWIVLFELSKSWRHEPGGVERVLRPVGVELWRAFGEEAGLRYDGYDFMCCVSV